MHIVGPAVWTADPHGGLVSPEGGASKWAFNAAPALPGGTPHAVVAESACPDPPPQAFRPDGRQSWATNMRRTHSLAVVEPPPEAGHIVRAFRLRVGFTEEELAHALGISLSTISRWENGHRKPSRLAWQALAQLAAENGWPLHGSR